MKRSDLQERVKESHNKLLMALDGFTEEQAAKPGVNPNWCARDALAHIVAWEFELSRILDEIRDGTYKPQKLPKEEIDEFNAKAVSTRHDWAMSEVADEYNAAHTQVDRAINELPDEVDESSRAYRWIEIVAIRHPADHATQIEEFRKQIGANS
jgi:hypothetical protein